MAGNSKDQDAAAANSSAGRSSNPDRFVSKDKIQHEIPKSQVGKLWEAFGSPEEPINVLPGANHSSTGGKAKDASLSDALRTLSANDVTTFYKAPCARDSLLVGIGAGFGVGGVRAVLGGLRALWPACNWAVGSFAVAAISAHEYCQRQRTKELDGMKEAVDMMRELKVKKQREREEARKAKEEAARLEEEKRRKSWTNWSNYKFW